MNEINGKLNGEGKKYAIVLSRFNSIFTERLLEGAVDCLTRHGVKNDDITVARVPGAFEIPIICQKLAATKKFDGVIALGAVIRGDTPHFDYVAGEVAKGVANVSLTTNTPIAFGVLTTDTIEQAEARSGSKGGNKGFDAAMTILEMTSVIDQIG